MKPNNSIPHIASGGIKHALNKLIQRAIIGQLTFTFFGVIALVAEDIHWPWWPLGLGMIVTTFALAFFVYSSVNLRRAYLLHVSYFIICTSWLLPLFYVAAGLISNTLLIILALISCGVILCVKFISDLRGLVRSSHRNQRSGRLNISTGLWDISKPIATNAQNSSNKKIWVAIAQIAASIGPIIGTLLYRSFSDESRLIGSLLFLILIFFVSPISGAELGVGVYLNRLEKEIGKRILVKI